MSIYSAIPCSEEHNTRSETGDIESGMSARVTLRCDWALRFALMEDILGRAWPDAAGCWATRASCSPDGGAYATVGQSCVYTQAIVTVEYGTKIEDLFSESLEPTAEFQIQDHKAFRWGAANGDPLLEGEAPGLLHRGLNLVRTLYQLPAIPAAVLTCVGKSNDAPYTSALLGLTFDTETLLFQPPTMNRAFKTDGTAGWTLQIKFNFKENGWNKFYRAKTGNWDDMFRFNGGQFKPYEPADFSDFLF